MSVIVKLGAVLYPKLMGEHIICYQALVNQCLILGKLASTLMKAAH